MFEKQILPNNYRNILRRRGRYDKKYYIYALPRSGKNAIIHWVASQYKLPICVRSKNFISSYGTKPEDYHFTLFFSEHEWFTLNQIKKHKRSKKVMIIRDVYNWIAAVLKTHMNQTGLSLKKLIKKDFDPRHPNNPNKNRLCLWKDYTREFLSNNSVYDIKISYNNWFQYKEYRKHLAGLFGFKFTDKGHNEIPNHRVGFGKSSFDGMNYKNNANNMPVLERYKYFNPKIFEQILDDEAIKLNKKFKEYVWK